MTKDLPSPELLRKLLRYEPETGKLFWRKRTANLFDSGRLSAEKNCEIWNNKFSGKEAFTAVSLGYKRGSIFNRMFLAHRVIWALENGFWPINYIDHIDGNRLNNKIVNLRAADQSQNLCNRKKANKNKSGYKGVCWYKRDQKWHAQIHKNGIRFHLGYFACPKEAYAAYCKAAKELHGEYANWG